MKRIKSLLSKWFLKLSKKLDTKSESASIKSHSNVDVIHARYEISDDMINSYVNSIGQDFLKKEIYHRLATGITNEIMKKYANKIKTIKNIERGSVTYFCDIYLYEPQEERDIR